MKKLLFLSFVYLVAINNNLYSQDIITKKSGDEIQAKIIRVSNSEIVYKRWTNLDGPDFIISASDIFMVKYQNGEKEVFANNKEGTIEKINGHNNVIRNNSIFGEAGGVGYFISLNYERIFLRDQKIFFAWRSGVSPMGSIGTVSSAFSFNVGSQANFFETGAGGGYLYHINNQLSENNYLYFTPTAGYRRMSSTGFLFKAYLSILTLKETYPQHFGGYSYITNYYPFLGFSFGYSF